MQRIAIECTTGQIPKRKSFHCVICVTLMVFDFIQEILKIPSVHLFYRFHVTWPTSTLPLQIMCQFHIVNSTTPNMIKYPWFSQNLLSVSQKVDQILKFHRLPQLFNQKEVWIFKEIFCYFLMHVWSVLEWSRMRKI